MPRLGGRRLHLVLILSKYLLTNSSFVLKVRTPFDPDNSVISLRLPNLNTMKFPDGAPTHQSIGYDPSSSAWSLAVRREPISKSCEITQADNLNRRRRLSRKAQ